MASIGAVSCDLVRGVSKTLAPRVQTWEIPGLDGYGAMTLGDGSAGGAFVAVRYSSRSTVISWASSLADLQGTVVTVTDDTGSTWTNQLITDVSVPVLAHAKDGSTTTRGECRVSTVRVA